MMEDAAPRPSEQTQPRWQPLAAIDRRVLGVLVEKAKTTPDGYPMTISGLRSGCNQKNNRYPITELAIEDIEESLTRLRGLGAVAEVQGSGRVSKYRHYMYEWLGVDKFELAIMTELLLRGAQTEGELRGRAARMDPIPDLNALRPLLSSLKGKNLIIALTPEGRGQVITHNLYLPRELEKLRAEHHSTGATHPVGGGSHSSGGEDLDEPQSAPASPANPLHAPRVSQAPASAAPAPVATQRAESFASKSDVEMLRQELEQTKEEIAKLRKDLEDLWSNFR